MALREIASRPAPRCSGLQSRYWRIDQGAVQGRYIFDDWTSLEAFLLNPGQDPAFETISRAPEELAPCEPSSESLASLDIIDRPVFIISAPRAGSTLLYELLATSHVLWTIDGESEGPIQGIPALHPAARGYDSHRLTDMDATPENVRALCAGFVMELRDCRGRRYLDLPALERPSALRMLEKTPENALRVAFLSVAFPDALFVLLHRDARQSISSILEAWHHDGFVNFPVLAGWRRERWHMLLPEGWRALDSRPLLDVASLQWASANRQALDDLDGLPRERWMSIDYDELVAVPAMVAQRIFDFANLTVDDGLAAALTRPLPTSSTTISPPSPLKWRSNSGLREGELHGVTQLSARLRSLGRARAERPSATGINTPIRFSCFLSEGTAASEMGGDDWIVAPSFHYQIGASVPLPLLRRTRFRERFLADYPLLWVEDPATNVMYPYWSDRKHALHFRQLVAGKSAPTLSSALAAPLVGAGILATRARLDEQKREGVALVEQVRTPFEQKRFCLLPSLLRRMHAAALAGYYRDVIAHSDWASGDEQVRLRHGHHNETMARYFHHQLADFVSRVAGEPVRPSYAYVSAYSEGAYLAPHVDRKQCIFTLSLLVEQERPDKPRPWPLWFQSHDGKVALAQKSGDGILFRGCELPHWREEPPPGCASTTLLFHYVPLGFTETLD
jgi:hypothetical protein